MQYALIKNNQFVEIKNFETEPENIPHKNVVWLPVIYENAEYNSLYQRLSQPKQRLEQNKYVIYCEAENIPETEYSSAIQNHINATAQSKQYSDGISLASYDSSTISSWAAEAQTFIAWRDAVWTYAFTELEKVKNGTRQQPSIEELLAELPEIVWPQ